MNTPASKKGSAPGLDEATVAALRGRVAAGELPFAAAVTLHLARGPGREGTEVARRVADLLADPAAADAPARLADDPAMLASFFQNADLLPRGDAVSLLVMEALSILDRSE